MCAAGPMAPFFVAGMSVLDGRVNFPYVGLRKELVWRHSEVCRGRKASSVIMLQESGLIQGLEKTVEESVADRPPFIGLVMMYGINSAATALAQSTYISSSTPSTSSFN